jgi:hypothetical protein
MSLAEKYIKQFDFINISIVITTSTFRRPKQNPVHLPRRQMDAYDGIPAVLQLNAWVDNDVSHTSQRALRK